MADEKEKKSPDKDLWEILGEIALWILAAYLVYRLIIGIKYGLDNFFTHSLERDNLFRRFYADPSWRNLRRMAETSAVLGYILLFFTGIKWISYLLCAFLLGIIVWLFSKLSKMDTAEHIELHTPRLINVEEDPGMKRWKRIVAYVQSANPSDWRLAILEADIILEEILDVSGYRGETIGEKLKSVEPSDMDTLNDAWEAHKIRNAIAHEGEKFILTEREARRVVGLYEKVFREFEFI